MSTASMDIFLNANDSLSFTDFLDVDIDLKKETDTLVGGPNDFSGFNFNELPSFEFEDVHDITWFNSNSNHSNLDFSGEDGPTMVNPNAVMPLMSVAQSVRSPSPSLKESHLTFSPATIKIAAIKPEATAIKKDLRMRLEEAQGKKPLIKSITKVTPILAKPVKTLPKPPTILTFRNAVPRPVAPAPISASQVTNLTTLRTVSTTPVNRKVHPRVIYDDSDRIFPKPAYSYSCLIAMALKNSRSGSLPVSEIYNFMCKHFPYFKTAPSGWKNSVRHNLSLNKCFEKIEKPALNGAQRKGCLWAMNPAKIIKMDEEVQKWSRKDPHAIKRAMVNPEHLELLERGEMKFASSYDETDHFGDSCGSAEEQSEASDSDQDQEQENNLNMQYEYIQVNNDDGSDLDVEASDCGFDEMEVEQDFLRQQMALAQKDLLDQERSVSNKRRRTYILQH
nr:forkhead box protein J1.2-like [Leptinotarsa decemlineata]